ncbi:hypothetical protein [Rhizobium leguminosarum]|uniref:hypothetical protein n=1 Tax=Rhizobium leguminosarum TaxID=384 RepID=UPI003D07290A
MNASIGKSGSNAVLPPHYLRAVDGAHIADHVVVSVMNVTVHPHRRPNHSELRSGGE